MHYRRTLLQIRIKVKKGVARQMTMIIVQKWKEYANTKLL